jgi:hypothetical protein
VQDFGVESGVDEGSEEHVTTDASEAVQVGDTHGGIVSCRGGRWVRERRFIARAGSSRGRCKTPKKIKEIVLLQANKYRLPAVPMTRNTGDVVSDAIAVSGSGHSCCRKPFVS